MRYPGDRHVLPLFGLCWWATYMRGNFIEKNTKLLGDFFFLSHTSKPNQQRQRDAVPKSAANIYPSNKYDFFPVILLLTNHEALFIIHIVLSFHPPFEPISAVFLQLQVCDPKSMQRQQYFFCLQTTTLYRRYFFCNTYATLRTELDCLLGLERDFSWSFTPKVTANEYIWNVKIKKQAMQNWSIVKAFEITRMQ